MGPGHECPGSNAAYSFEEVATFLASMGPGHECPGSGSPGTPLISGSWGAVRERNDVLKLKTVRDRQTSPQDVALCD